jgi:hypothetical protein
MSSVDYPDTCTFKHSKCAKATRVGMLTLDLDYARACSDGKRQKRTRLRAGERTHHAIEAVDTGFGRRCPGKHSKDGAQLCEHWISERGINRSDKFED